MGSASRFEGGHRGRSGGWGRDFLTSSDIRLTATGGPARRREGAPSSPGAPFRQSEPHAAGTVVVVRSAATGHRRSRMTQIPPESLIPNNSLITKTAEEG